MDSAHLGSVNGLGQTFASFARAAGPTFCGALWSLGTQLHFTPLPFLVIGLACILALFLSLWLPPSLRYPYGKQRMLSGTAATTDSAAAARGTAEPSPEEGAELSTPWKQQKASPGGVELV